MSTEAKPPDQRRAHVREAVLFPIRMTFLGTSDDATSKASLAKLGAIFAIAVDISPAGMQVVLAGAAAKPFLTDLTNASAVQIEFVHPELKRLRDVRARVRWSRGGDARGECVLGLKFDREIPPESVNDIKALGPLHAPRPAPSRLWLGAFFLAAVAASLAWLDARGTIRARDESLTKALHDSEESQTLLSDCKEAMDRKGPSPQDPSSDAGVGYRGAEKHGSR